MAAIDKIGKANKACLATKNDTSFKQNNNIENLDKAGKSTAPPHILTQNKESGPGNWLIQTPLVRHGKPDRHDFRLYIAL